jgi:diguanylate cyclase (GGDEF)-like protein
LFDIDYFKNVNDAYGHQAGDEVIRLTADQVRKKVRATDIPGRYGGEEFGIILIDTSAGSARYLAERLRKAIELMTVEYEGCEISSTISVGVAELTDKIEMYRDWLACADQALYRAKKAGRNRVILYQDAD